MSKEEMQIMIGMKIRSLRKEKNLSLQAFADKLNMEYNNVIRLEKGRTNPTLGTLYKVVQVLNVSLKDIVDGV